MTSGRRERGGLFAVGGVSRRRADGRMSDTRRALYENVRGCLMAVYEQADDARTLEDYGEAIACLDALYVLSRRVPLPEPETSA